MVLATNLGFPRIGPKRELKKAVEAYWAGRLDERQLVEVGRELRKQNWQLQRDLGLAHIPSNDFSLYDQMLDTSALAGAIPARFGDPGNLMTHKTYFAMARGVPSDIEESNVAAMEMTKWFDTNYHYIVPEFTPGQEFRLASRKPISEFLEAKGLGIHTRPVLIGPITYLLLGKCAGETFDRLDLLDRLLPVYERVLVELAEAGATWVQLDEPAFVLDLTEHERDAFRQAYRRLGAAAPGLRLLLATYFGELRDNLRTACELPVAGLHVDLVQGSRQLDDVLAAIPASMHLSLGVIDGRNIWRADLDRAIGQVRQAVIRLGEDRVYVAPACSLLLSPIDLELETELDPELRSWLAFAKQKLAEVSLVARVVNGETDAIAIELKVNQEAIYARHKSGRVHNQAVKARMSCVTAEMLTRRSIYPDRKRLQRQRLELPVLPTTTIGSFPQTKEVRAARADFKAGRLSEEQYELFLRQQIADAISFQLELGLDVLVHGEAERNDMVEYFGERLDGFAFTQNGWVQSYGSRCVKPPVILGDVSRPSPMTVKWIQYAQSLTDKPVKGMLTGPVTILQWSFVRDDQPRSETCRQIALAIRDEAIDLEKAGIAIIQIDEAALREGLPLRRADWAAYLKWSVDCFRLTASGVADETQIHTHMCYSEFNDIIPAITAMDADVISIESSRSRMELLKAFEAFAYPNEIGPGVYDIHSPRVPSTAEMVDLLRTAQGVLLVDQLWVNPDCGLKTRGWPEVRVSLRNMVDAAKQMRSEIASVSNS